MKKEIANAKIVQQEARKMLESGKLAFEKMKREPPGKQKKALALQAEDYLTRASELSQVARKLLKEQTEAN